MRIAVLGTGIVGSTIASKLVEQGHEVKLAARTRGNEKAIAWVKRAASNATEGSFADAASFGETVFNCTAGAASLAALDAAGPDHLRGKMLIDVGQHVLFIGGNDESAKAQVATWLNQWLGWRPEQILDLGDITAARATEMMIPLWVRLYMTLGSPLFNYQINRGG